MSDILADYREWSDQQAARVSTHSAGCHMWHKDCMIHRLADALERARLTDEEREAIQFMLRHGASGADADPYPDSDDYPLHNDTLRGLLERMK